MCVDVMWVCGCVDRVRVDRAKVVKPRPRALPDADMVSQSPHSSGPRGVFSDGGAISFGGGGLMCGWMRMCGEAYG